MKKVLSIFLTFVFTFMLCVPALAVGAGIVSALNAEATENSVTVSGTTSGVKAAVVVQVLNNESNILAMESLLIVDNSFSGVLDKLSLTIGETYTVRVADYDGGTWKKITVTVPDPPDSGDEISPPSGGETTPPSTPTPYVMVLIPSSDGNENAPKVEATISGSSAVVKDIPVAEIAKNSTGTVSMDFSGLEQPVDEVKLPVTTMETIADSESGGLEITLSTASVVFDAAAVDAISDTATGEDIALNVEIIDQIDLSAKQKQSVEGLGDALIIKATLTSGGEIISDFGAGSAKLTVPYEKKNADYVPVVYFLDDSGKMTRMNAVYDPVTKTITFTTPHFSEYAVAELEPLPFTDVPETQYYAEAVRWAYQNKVTAGTSATTFSPDASCTRAQTVTFLWRAYGSPEPTLTENPFSDVIVDTYYYKAVLWAYEKGITAGTSDTTFSPDATVIRAQVVAFLWRASNSPAAEGTKSFSDVPADSYYTKAVLWAAENGVADGTGEGKFSPEDACIRAQIVTFLWRDLV